ncbi:hypothetical protein K1719_025694 [Acacia pycnantha]|nr:hypothetical protein K1719_025694 [Acacia pycnantha]
MRTDSNSPNQIAYLVFHASFPVIFPRSSHGFRFTNSPSAIAILFEKLVLISIHDPTAVFATCFRTPNPSDSRELVEKWKKRDEQTRPVILASLLYENSGPLFGQCAFGSQDLIAHMLRIKDHTSILWLPKEIHRFIALAG